MPEERATENGTAEPQNHFVMFLPYVRLDRRYRVAGVDFLPLRDAERKVPEELKTAVTALDVILSGYMDRHGKPFTSSAVAAIDGKWDLAHDNGPAVRWAVYLLFFASWAANQLFSRFGRPVNSTSFRVVGQAYSGGLPYYITISARRRNGQSMDGGYTHGEVKFNLPLQCSIRDVHAIDEALLAALDKANAAGSDVIARLRTAIPFIELANTDDDFLTLDAEGILMASAFEQLLKGDASSYRLGKHFGALFDSFGGVTVADAQKARPHIRIDDTKPERAAAQPKWWIHRKWMEELYDLRSKVVHEGTPDAREWGWTPFEHLLMAAHVFPLTVKLMLAAEGHYTLTEEDRICCLVVDHILASPKWYPRDDDEADTKHSAEQIFADVRFKIRWERAAQRLYPPEGEAPTG